MRDKIWEDRIEELQEQQLALVEQLARRNRILADIKKLVIEENINVLNALKDQKDEYMKAVYIGQNMILEKMEIQIDKIVTESVYNNMSNCDTSVWLPPAPDRD